MKFTVLVIVGKISSNYTRGTEVQNFIVVLVDRYAFCNKRSHGTKSAMLEGKLIIIPALGH